MIPRTSDRVRKKTSKAPKHAPDPPPRQPTPPQELSSDGIEEVEPKGPSPPPQSKDTPLVVAWKVLLDNKVIQYGTTLKDRAEGYDY